MMNVRNIGQSYAYQDRLQVVKTVFPIFALRFSIYSLDIFNFTFAFLMNERGIKLQKYSNYAVRING